METDQLSQLLSQSNSNSKAEPEKQGQTVFYGLFGRCKVIGIEEKVVQNKKIHFYRLEKVRSNLARNQKSEPNILVPITSQDDLVSLRVTTPDDAEIIWNDLISKEYFLSLEENTKSIQNKVEGWLRKEGPKALGRAYSFLFVYSKKKIAPETATLRLFETVSKLLIKELTELQPGEDSLAIENKVLKAVRSKLSHN